MLLNNRRVVWWLLLIGNLVFAGLNVWRATVDNSGLNWVMVGVSATTAVWLLASPWEKE